MGDPVLRESGCCCCCCCCCDGDCRTSRILIVADENQEPVVGVQMEEGRWGEECR